MRIWTLKATFVRKKCALFTSKYDNNRAQSSPPADNH